MISPTSAPAGTSRWRASAGPTAQERRPDTSTGVRGKGEWRAEDGKLCSQPPGRNWGCNDVRLINDVLHLKRDSGEIIQLIAQ
jgi:hypothetical protein